MEDLPASEQSRHTRPMGKHEAMDEETVAELLDVSTRQIRTYRSDGMPSKLNGRSHTYNWPQVLAWYVSYKAEQQFGTPVDPDDEAETEDDGAKKEDQYAANLRKTRAEADLKQLALSRQRGEVVTIADVKLRLDRLFINLRSQLLGLPPALSTRIEGEPNAPAREAAIRDAMENLCRELSTGAIVGALDEASTEAVGDLAAAAEREYSDDDVNRIVIEFLAAHAELVDLQATHAAV